MRISITKKAFLSIILIIIFAVRAEAVSNEEISHRDCCSSVIFFPGFEGTRLHQGTNQLWEPNFIRDIDKLGLDENGNSINKDIWVGEIIRRTNVGIDLLNKDIYQGISDDLDKLVADGYIEEWKAYPYDWRDDLPIPYDISHTIYDMVNRSYTNKIIIIGHSNGGVLAKKIATIMGDRKEHLESLITVGAPQTGNLSGLLALLHGDEQSIAGGFIASNGAMREFGRNMRGAYNFIPSKSFYSSHANPPY